jgi:hypothetical protein
MWELTIGWIQNSLDLRFIGLTENLRPYVETNPNLEIAGGPMEWPFDKQGNLPQVLPIPERVAATTR